MILKKTFSIMLALAIALNAVPAAAAKENSSEEIREEISESELPFEEKDGEEASESQEEEKAESESTPDEESSQAEESSEAVSEEVPEALPLYEVTEALPLENTAVTASVRHETTQDGQIQTYYQEDGTAHKIYWAQGVTPPLMPSNPEDAGTPGYFHREVIIDNKGDSDPSNDVRHVTYLAPYEEGRGYFDLNKMDPYGVESHLCYLATASNLLHWWFVQNEAYINEYVAGLKDGTFGQEPGLKTIVPGEERSDVPGKIFTEAEFDAMWNNIRALPPVVTEENAHETQLIRRDELVKTAFMAYVNHDDGYFTHAVVDFFINGYPLIQPQPIKDTPENYQKDKRGGYFYPVFGMEPIAQEIKGNYNTLSRMIKEHLLTGHGLGLDYLFANNNRAHAITVWGAEYDENDMLVRLFVTDSDDIQNIVPGTDCSGGLHSTNVYSDDGAMYLSSEEKKGSTAGSKIDGFVTLSLAQDRWEEVLNDREKPAAPLVSQNPSGNIYAKGSACEPLKAEGTAPGDGGFITYQWYKASMPDAEGEMIPGANKNTYTPSAAETGTSYYYCLVSNNKKGHRNSVKTSYAKIDVQDIERVDAEIPSLEFNYDTAKYQQYACPGKLTVKASVKDGGTLSYQWYETYDNNASSGWAVTGETNPTFIPSTNVLKNYESSQRPGGRYYYCVVTNTNEKATGSKTASAVTRLAKRVIVLPNPAFPGGVLTDAVEPMIGIRPSSPLSPYEKHQEAEPLFIYARAFDGGSVSYQWYEEINGEAKPLEGENKERFIPYTDKAGERSYFCRVTNFNERASGKKEAFTESLPVTVTVSGEPDIPAKESFLKGRVETSSDGKKVTLKLLAEGKVMHETEIPAGSSDGSFIFEKVSAGVYDLLIEKDNHIPFELTGIILGENGLDLKSDERSEISNIRLTNGDINRDKKIGSSDIELLTSKDIYGSQNFLYDLDGSGKIDFDDLKIMRSSENFGRTFKKQAY